MIRRWLRQRRIRDLCALRVAQQRALVTMSGRRVAHTGRQLLNEHMIAVTGVSFLVGALVAPSGRARRARASAPTAQREETRERSRARTQRSAIREFAIGVTARLIGQAFAAWRMAAEAESRVGAAPHSPH